MKCFSIAPSCAKTAIGLASLLALPFGSPSASAMDIVRFANQVVMSGDVVGDECVRLGTALDAHPEVKTVVLRNSRGGDADAGYCVGELLRTARATPRVSMRSNGLSRRLRTG